MKQSAMPGREPEPVGAGAAGRGAVGCYRYRTGGLP